MSGAGHRVMADPKAERRWVVWFGILVMLMTSIPYFIGYLRQGELWQFTGFTFGVEDGNSYIAKMLSSAYGAWLFRTPYTTIYQRGVAAFIPYLALGKLAAGSGLHEQLVALYHVFRIGSGILAILATYEFLSLTIKNIELRRFGLVLCVLGGGLGWLAIALGSRSLPLEFYSPETFGFLGLFGLPHLALARATFLWSLVIYLRFVTEGASVWWKQSFWLGLLWLGTAVAQPISAIVLGAVIGLHCMATGFWQAFISQTRALRGISNQNVISNEVRDLDSSVASLPRNDNSNRDEKEEFKRWWGVVRMAAVSFLIPAPLLLYTYLSFSLDPFLSAWTLQNIIRSPEPAQYLLAYGLILPFAISGMVYLLRLDTWRGLFFAAWVLALPLLAYAPFNLQRRLLEGMWVALVALAMTAFEYWHGKSPSASSIWVRRRGLSRWILLLALPSTFVLAFGAMLASWYPAMPVFRLKDETLAFGYLKQSAAAGDVVLASFDTSNALPAWAPLRVVIGHGPESVGLADLQPRVQAFYTAGANDEERKQILKEQKVRYVFWGPLERQLGSWDPGTAPYLRKVYEAGEFQIFEITPDLNL